MSCLLAFVSCLCGLLGVISLPIAEAGSNNRGNQPKLATEPTPAIRSRAIVKVGTNSDDPLIRLSADGQLLATGTGKGPVRVWDALTGRMVAMPLETDGQSPRAFSPVNGRLLASANLKSVSLYDLTAMKLKSQVLLEKVFGGLNFFGSFSPNGQWFIVNSLDRGKVSLWEVETAQMKFSFPCEVSLFPSQFSNDSQTILTSCGDSKATLWDVRTGKAILTFSSPRNVSVSTFSPDNKTVAMATQYGHVLIWDAFNGQLKKAFQEHRESISNIAFSRDGKILATVSKDGNAILWDIENLQLKQTLRVGSNALLAVFSPDSKLLVVTGGMREVAVWDVATGQRAFNVTGHRKEIDNVAFSPDGRLLVSSSDDAVNVWVVANRKLLTKLDNAGFPIEFSSNGKTLVTAGLKGTVILWDVVWP